jgi:hypothetical protein
VSKFVFGEYEFDQASFEAKFSYSFEDYSFTERVQFTKPSSDYNRDALTRALDLAHLLIGVSYYKAFPTREVAFKTGGIDQWQADFLDKVYQEGLGQYAYENNLKRSDLAHFAPTADGPEAVSYSGKGILSLQSGGKDSLLVASLLQKRGRDFSPFYISNGVSHPAVLDTLGEVVVAKRLLDHAALQKAAANSGLNGHVPVTYIVQAIALIQAILLGKDTVLTAIGHEGEEPRTYIDDLPINHQWSKTWPAEQAFAEYVHRYISPDITIGSPLRQYSELKIAELFVQNAWGKYGDSFSSCNMANYSQGTDNTTLRWCGNCPKCANSYLLFAPFVEAKKLQEIFGGDDLFIKPGLTETFKGLLGIDNIPKPFECVGEVDELRYAYQKAQENGGYGVLPFTVPASAFDKDQQYPSQVIQL